MWAYIEPFHFSGELSYDLDHYFGSDTALNGLN
jgi:hypothetical protein